MADKGHPETGHKGPKGMKTYSSNFSLTSALNGLGGPQGRGGRTRKISPPPEFDPRAIQPVASRYTDYATSAHHGR
jgi:hypothetical protein